VWFLCEPMYVVFLRCVLRLLVTAEVVPSLPILVTLIMEALRSSETLVLTRATKCNIPEDGILHSHVSESLKSYIRCNILHRTPVSTSRKFRH
jgi:hypothetical protein